MQKCHIQYLSSYQLKTKVCEFYQDNNNITTATIIEHFLMPGISLRSLCVLFNFLTIIQEAGTTINLIQMRKLKFRKLR